MTGSEHLHHDDVPATLAILADLLDHRSALPEGYEPTKSGAWVDWEALCRSWLSSTEVAAVRIAQGCALAERHVGLPLSVAGAVRETVRRVDRLMRRHRHRRSRWFRPARRRGFRVCRAGGPRPLLPRLASRRGRVAEATVAPAGGRARPGRTSVAADAAPGGASRST